MDPYSQNTTKNSDIYLLMTDLEAAKDRVYLKVVGKGDVRHVEVVHGRFWLWLASIACTLGFKNYDIKEIEKVVVQQLDKLRESNLPGLRKKNVVNLFIRLLNKTECGNGTLQITNIFSTSVVDIKPSFPGGSVNSVPEMKPPLPEVQLSILETTLKACSAILKKCLCIDAEKLMDREADSNGKMLQLASVLIEKQKVLLDYLERGFSTLHDERFNLPKKWLEAVENELFNSPVFAKLEFGHAGAVEDRLVSLQQFALRLQEVDLASKGFLEGYAENSLEKADGKRAFLLLELQRTFDIKMSIFDVDLEKLEPYIRQLPNDNREQMEKIVAQCRKLDKKTGYDLLKDAGELEKKAFQAAEVFDWYILKMRHDKGQAQRGCRLMMLKQFVHEAKEHMSTAPVKKFGPVKEAIDMLEDEGAFSTERLHTVTENELVELQRECLDQLRPLQNMDLAGPSSWEKYKAYEGELTKKATELQA